MRLIFSCLFIFLFITLKAQQPAVSAKPDYAKDPVWIKMMDDPNTNYYEALKAYDMYWKNHKQPVDEEELMNQGKEKVGEEEEEKDKEERLTPAEKEEQNRMRYQSKRFERWKQEVFPFVQTDGRILTDQERLKIWNQQQEEMKNQNHK